MNETIKEGDWVEYVGRPNEKFLVYQNDLITNYPLIQLGVPLKIILHGLKITFNEKGFFIDGDTHPIVKKTTPPKKKVIKEFDVEILKVGNCMSALIGFNDLSVSEIILKNNKAKILIEVEE